MTVTLSTGLINAMLSDEVALKVLEDCYQGHMAGDKTALMSVLITCAALQAVIPDWAVDELLTLEEGIQSGEIRDLNKFFGFKAENKAALKRRIETEKSYSTVQMKLIEHRLLGGNFSARGDISDGLREVAEVTKTPARIVEEIYSENKDKLLKLPRNSSKDEGYIVANLSVPMNGVRRRGRPTLKD